MINTPFKLNLQDYLINHGYDEQTALNVVLNYIGGGLPKLEKIITDEKLLQLIKEYFK